MALTDAMALLDAAAKVRADTDAAVARATEAGRAEGFAAGLEEGRAAVAADIDAERFALALRDREVLAERQGAIAHLALEVVRRIASSLGPEETMAAIVARAAADVAPDTALATEEVFGPVIGFERVDGLEHAIESANSVRFGLSAAICTRDMAAAQRFAADIQAGMVRVNRPTVGAAFNAPFGACPECSGLGTRMSVDQDLLIGDEDLSIDDGVIIPWTTQGKGLYQYYEKLLELLRPGALIAVDNTLALAGEPIIKLESPNAKALRELNEFLRGDERVDLAMLTVGEGLTLLRKRG